MDARSAQLLDHGAVLPDHVVFREFPAETVVLNLKNGTYHGLNPSAARMLEALTSEPTIGAAASAIARLYGAPLEEVEEDIQVLCAELAERDLIELRGEAG
jgi:hypothetical protein